MQLPHGTTLPPHLAKYVVTQNVDAYSPVDHAVWRFITRQLLRVLRHRAHRSYADGFEQVGLCTDHIPCIADLNEHLSRFGWGAVPVSGFIPPAIFMEFQARGVLPIATAMRTMSHIPYTPAPDIVHEAAGHAPMLVLPEYAQYLRNYAEVARRAVISREDVSLYEAIRVLSDVKEQTESTPEEIKQAEANLEGAKRGVSFISEGQQLSRLHWWTVEYGLIGSPDAPRIFGAGLLSSIGESQSCLHSAVDKLPLSLECIDYGYDITEPQPQLFVTPDFDSMNEVLEALAVTMAYRHGGRHGLLVARSAKTVNTVELDSGLQMAGVLEDFELDDGDRPSRLQFAGRTQLAYGGEAFSEIQTADDGFIALLGNLRDGASRDILNRVDIARAAVGSELTLEFESRIAVRGRLCGLVERMGQPLILSFDSACVFRGERAFWTPGSGTFHLAVGERVRSVFGGPADRERFEEQRRFTPHAVPARELTDEEARSQRFYAAVRCSRDSPRKEQHRQLQSLIEEFLSARDGEWLAGVELLELAASHGLCIADQLADLLRARDYGSAELSAAVNAAIEDASISRAGGRA
ncbi:MAG: aromatic amino acid hydroxylase [Gammaproteobacteria bacterium]|nr:aromatic amino acid hydroxylase [Gammaproteobacteria bacterium]